MLERFLCAPFKAEVYPLMEGSHRPLGNKLAGILKHSGNKLASMLDNIKDSFVCHFKTGHNLMEGSYNPLGIALSLIERM